MPVYFHDNRQGKEHENAKPSKWDSNLVQQYYSRQNFA